MTADSRSATLPALPSLSAQVDRLVELDVPALAGIPEETLRAAAERWGSDRTEALLAIHPQVSLPSVLAPLLRRSGRPGFVVEDMTDVDQFAPVGIELPGAHVYLVHDPDRGDDLANWTPGEALPVLEERSRTPLLLSEGIHWALQQGDVLERNHCFMTIGSRLRKPTGTYDSRTPALWISNGTGRDGRERRDAPKLGWCWWGNRHTWLGIASAARRSTGPGS